MNKGALQNFLPDFEFLNLTDIDVNFFLKSQLIIFDIDNTLVFYQTAESTKKVMDWFFNINSRYKCICLSNNSTIFKRKDRISELLNCEVLLSRYKKPSKKLFEEIKKKYKFENCNVFVVGDRIFTDMLFGNRNGARTVLVKPLGAKENILIKISRVFEKLILFWAVFQYNKK